MRTEIANISAAGSVQQAVPQSLDGIFQQHAGPGYDGFSLTPRPPTPEETEAAKAALPSVERLTGPVDPAILRAWLKRLSGALPVGGAQHDPKRVEHAIQALCDTFGMLPAACFTDETRAQVMRKCRFFPGPAEISEILEPIAAREKRSAGAVRFIAGYNHAPALPPPAAPSQAERDAACARSQSVKAELRAMGTAARGGDEKPQPRHLTPLQLALAYRAAGRPLRPGLQAVLDQHEARTQNA